MWLCSTERAHKLGLAACARNEAHTRSVMVAITRQLHALAGGLLPAEWPGIIQAQMNFQ